MTLTGTLTKLGAAALAVSATAALAACSSDDSSSESAASSTAATSAPASTDTAPALPAAADLNAVLAKATDPNVSLEEKTSTVQGGETAPELFDVMAQSQAESGASFLVVDPVLPGYTPDSVLSTVTFTVPGQPEQTAENVEFVYEDGQWKLSQAWACTLISNTVPPEQVPAMCAAPAPAEGADPAAPAEQAPADPAAPAAPAEQAPAEAPAEAPAP